MPHTLFSSRVDADAWTGVRTGALAGAHRLHRHLLTQLGMLIYTVDVFMMTTIIFIKNTNI